MLPFSTCAGLNAATSTGFKSWLTREDPGSIGGKVLTAALSCCTAAWLPGIRIWDGLAPLNRFGVLGGLSVFVLVLPGDSLVATGEVLTSGSCVFNAGSEDGVSLPAAMSGGAALCRSIVSQIILWLISRIACPTSGSASMDKGRVGSDAAWWTLR